MHKTSFRTTDSSQTAKSISTYLCYFKRAALCLLLVGVFVTLTGFQIFPKEQNPPWPQATVYPVSFQASLLLNEQNSLELRRMVV
jgi:hypothetical protein